MTAAWAMVEALRWPARRVAAVARLSAATPTKRPGRWRCGKLAGRKDFAVTADTVMEASHIPLHKWLLRFSMIACSKKGVSSRSSAARGA